MTCDGYTGGDGEQALVIAANKLLSLGEADTITKIKQQYWKLGEIMEIAAQRGYTKVLGTKGWVATNLRCSHTHAYDCLNAYKQRSQFDQAYQWYKELNTGWQPSKMTGPRFALEIIKAWRKRGQSESEALAEANKKKRSTIKDAIEAAKKWESRFVRLRDETRKLAEYADREPVVLQAIELEIATEEGDGEIQPGFTDAKADQRNGTDPVVQEDGPDTIAAASQDDPQPPTIQVIEKKLRKPRQKRIDRIPPTGAVQTNKMPDEGSSLDWQPSETLAATAAAQQIVGGNGHAD